MPHLIKLLKLLVLVFVIASAASSADANWLTKITKAGDAAGDLRGGAALGRLANSIDAIAPGATHRYLLDFRSDRVTFKDVMAGKTSPGVAVTTAEKFQSRWADVSNAIIIEQNQVDTLGRWLPDKTEKRTVILLDKDKRPYLASVGISGRKVDVDVLLRSNLTYRFMPPPDLGALGKMLAVPIVRSDTRVVSIFDDLDVDVNRAIDRAAGDTHRRLAENSLDGLEALVKREKPNLVILVGHVEDGAFTIRTPTGEVGGRIDMDAAERLLDRHDATGLFLGCEAGSLGVSGFMGCVNALHVSEGLSGIRDGTTHGELLAALTTRAGPILMQPRLANGVLRGFEARLNADRGAQSLDRGYFVARLSTVQLAQASGAAGFRMRDALQFFLLHPVYWFWAWIGLTVAGLVSTIFLLRRYWRRYKEAFPLQATALSSPWRKRLATAVRAFTFFSVFPALAVLQTLVLLASAFVLLGLFVEQWLACLGVAFGAAVIVPFLNRAERSVWRTFRQDWRDMVVTAGLPVLISMVLFNRPFLAETGLGPAIRPWLIPEALAMLATVSTIGGLFLYARHRWGLGAYSMLYRTYEKVVFGLARDIDRRLVALMKGV